MHSLGSTAVGPRPPLPLSALNGRGGVVRFTVRDVEAMLEIGILREDATTELLHGIVVLKDRSDVGEEPTVISNNHRLSVNKLTALAVRVNSDDQHVQTQNPIVCGEYEVPEPDFAILRGPVGALKDRLPTGADVTCVVEVAHSSLERDSEEKLQIYAAAGVPQYVVLNLRDRTAQLYVSPDPAAGTYRHVSVLSEAEDLALSLPTGGTLTLRVSELLP
jgi:Uma2 family endonuclease